MSFEGFLSLIFLNRKLVLIASPPPILVSALELKQPLFFLMPPSTEVADGFWFDP